MPAQDKVRYSQIAIALKTLIVACIFGTFTHCSLSGNWEAFVVCAPFAIGLIPGYFNLLPKGGMRHGSSCDCLEPDEACEFGFWFEIAQKVILILPILLSSIFLSYFIMEGLRQALVETAMATLTAVLYSAVCAVAVYVLVKLRGL